MTKELPYRDLGENSGSIFDKGSDFYLIHSVLIGSEIHLASCPMGIKESFPRGKGART
jgi:hypothetical protein